MIARTIDPKRPVVAFDADGVLLDLKTGYRALAAEVLGRPLAECAKSYCFKERFGLTEDEAAQVRTRLYTAEGMSALPALPGAVATVAALRREGFQVAVVTGIPPFLEEARHRNFATLGIEVDAIFCTGSAFDSKRHILEAVNALSYVDDHLDHVEHARAAGVLVLGWIDQDYGCHYDRPKDFLHCYGPSLAEIGHELIAKVRSLLNTN
jgi:phosphoglycolate phosphatase-like HAD superfamily hydrolase